MKRILITYILSCLGALMFLSACYGQQTNIKTASGETIHADQLDRFIEEKMHELNMPGLSIAVINDGQIVYHRTLGVKHAETREPVSDQTLFEAASVTKSVFAYFVMRTVEMGLLNLDMPLHEYLPNYDLDHDDRYKQITARMVLSHQTGMPNWRFENKGQYLNLRFDPGSGFSYSGEGYEYLANVIAHLQGGTRKELDNLFNEVVFDFLKMENASFVWDESMKVHKAHGHNGGVANTRYEPVLPWVAGGIHTEAVSFGKFIVALMEEKGLSEASVRELLKNQVTIPRIHLFADRFGLDAWGLGFGIEDTPYGRAYSHGGNNGDFQSHFEFFKEKKIGYVFFTNCAQGESFNNALNTLLRTGHPEEISEDDRYEVLNRRLRAYEADGIVGVALDAGPSDGVAYLKDALFSEGVIELDLKGENMQGQSFVGISFHAEDEKVFEGIYFRPFNFDAPDITGQSHMVQYHNIPDHSWRMLRREFPGKYEAAISNPPGPDDWFHARIEVKGNLITVFVNDIKEPVLTVMSLSKRKTGKIGLWVGSNSSGRFANLKITSK